uniref:Uncharacterized protein n=1 Tax=Rhizophora mucronata TaxID=61149 RepID=A0A2P2R4X3_RHIMU
MLLFFKLFSPSNDCTPFKLVENEEEVEI